jgi:Patatin-like phospholipase.
MNNSILPLLFLLFYLVKAMQYDLYRELISVPEWLILVFGFLGGLSLLIAFSFAYFFGADRTILRTIAPVVANPEHFKKTYNPVTPSQSDGFGMKVTYFLTGRFRFKKARPVSHYSEQFLETIFKRHHFAAMIGILLAFIFLITAGFFLDVKFFQVPAAASIFIFFAIMVAVIGALTYFLQSWSLLFVIGLGIILNVLYQEEIIDPRNKAYGLNYNNKEEQPEYNRTALLALCTPSIVERDRANMLTILNNWKRKQDREKPVMIFINVSGGGLRSATFVMNTLQQLDSITNGRVMKQAFLINGASGGMLSATYYRELYKVGKTSPIDLHSKQFTDRITQDLLNPIFSSMISRDIFSPAQKFSIGSHEYIKDRGYAFEQKLNENSGDILNKQIKDYAADEKAANLPMIIYNSVITRDGRKMMIGTQPLSFLMKPLAFANDTLFTPDAVDFGALFSKQDPANLRLLTALRMNATFPYVLPNVWLPSNPVIDVMDAGIRDNYGQETTLRFIDNFKDWLTQNTSGIVILQIRDRISDNWQHPLETGSITDIIVKPATILQHNWYKLQDYFQADQYTYTKDSAMYNLHRLTFIYVPKKEEQGAALNFHLTASEKKDVIASFGTSYNQQVLKKLLELMGPQPKQD